MTEHTAYKDLLKVVIAASVWCIVHSLLISETAKKVTENLPVTLQRWYRFVYNVFSAISFAWLILYLNQFHAEPVFTFSGLWTILQAALLITSILLFKTGAGSYNMRRFIGIDQIKSGKHHTSLSSSGNLNVNGILNITRHPWYLGALCFIWSVDQDIHIFNLSAKLIFTLYIFIGTLLEERKLIREFGAQYIQYCEKVSMLFPFKFLQKQFKRIILR